MARHAAGRAGGAARPSGKGVLVRPASSFARRAARREHAPAQLHRARHASTLLALAEIADREGIWFHVDAAWGGSAALSGRLRPLLEGIELADSATWDAHKGMSVPMGAGMFFSRAPETLSRAFAVSATYMPAGGGQLDPFACTPQWSRRAIGLNGLSSPPRLGIAASLALG